VAKKIVPEEKDKPVLDEGVFSKLLEAAYVLQEHNRELQKLELDLEHQKDRLGVQEQFAPIPPQGAAQPQAAEPTSTEPLLAEPSSAKPPLAEPAVPDPPPEPALAEPALAEPVLAEPASLGPAPKDDYTFTLAQIVGTQDQIRMRHLALENAMSLVAERVTEIAKAGGAAIAFLDGKNVRYRGAAGLMTLPVGTEVPMEKALCAACLRTGQVIRCADVNPEFLVDAEECHRRGIQAMIAVPVYHDGGIAAGLELYYAKMQTFTEQDVHTCQLMAGLITEALAREDELSLKKSLANERAVMLEALEKLKPNLAAIVDAPAGRGSAQRRANPATESSGPTFICRKCGHKLVGEEQFCGKCGSPRSRDYEPPSMQSKVASLWHMQEALKKSAPATPPNGDVIHQGPPAISVSTGPEKPLADSIEEEMPEFFAAPELRVGRMPQPPEFAEGLAREPIEAAAKPEITIPLEAVPEDAIPEDKEGEGEDEVQDEPPVETALAKPVHAANWSSAMTAREFLEQLAGVERPGALARFWKTRRGDIYLAIAIILVAAVIRWGIWSSHSVSATGSPTAAAASHRKPAPDADLSMFDRMLISLGLAEAPPAPEYKGNPDTQVWVDLHTALYYCPGADLYGKTPKGKFESQRDAQLDQYEPAYRKTCD
jgi:putative methionine-R-sulfoxide reductase with GAF domain